MDVCRTISWNPELVRPLQYENSPKGKYNIFTYLDFFIRDHKISLGNITDHN